MQQFCYSFYDVKLEITIREAQIGIFTKKEGITANHDRNVLNQTAVMLTRRARASIDFSHRISLSFYSKLSNFFKLQAELWPLVFLFCSQSHGSHYLVD